MTVRAKTLVKDKFWIMEQNGEKLGTLQKQEDNGWIFLSKQDKNDRQVFHTQESLLQNLDLVYLMNQTTLNQTKRYRPTTLTYMVSLVVNIRTTPCLM